MKEMNFSVCIITPPLNKSGIRPVSNLIEIISHITSSLFIISGNELENIKISTNAKVVSSLTYNYNIKGIYKVLEYIKLQLRISYNLLVNRNKFEVIIYFFGSHLLLPIVISKVLNKKIVLQLGGSSSNSSCYSRSYYSKILSILEKIGFILADKLIVYSPSIIEEWGLNRYMEKISIMSEHLVDLDHYYITDKYENRKHFIGYIGRLSEEKGVLNFIKSLKIVRRFTDVDILLIGDGYLKTEIEQYLHVNDLMKNVKMIGWVDHKKLPRYLNELKLLVLPSYTEGLPNIILESIACGTPVLATSVGAIPDVIKDNETGFIMEDNSPECIARNVVRALDCSEIESIIRNAEFLLSERFSMDKTIDSYRLLFHDIGIVGCSN